MSPAPEICAALAAAAATTSKPPNSIIQLFDVQFRFVSLRFDVTSCHPQF